MNPYLDPFEKRLIPKIQEITADKVVTLTEFLDASGTAIDVTESIMDELKVFNATDKQFLLDAAGQLYDRYVTPIDIKRIPNWIERAAKPFIREQMLSGLGEWIDQYVSSNFVGGARK